MDPSVGGLMTVTAAVPVSPHAMVSTIAHWAQARVPVPGPGGGDMGGPREQKHHPAAAGEKHKYGPHSSSLIRLRAAAAGAVI